MLFRSITFPNESGNVHTSGGDTTHTNIIIGDAGTIGSASDVDAISIGSDGDITLTQDLELQHDGATVSFGAENDTILTHTDGSGLTLNSTNKIMFNDASQFIHAPSATVLDLAATDEIELTATLIDVVGNFTNSGTLVSTGVVTANAGVVVDEMTLDADTITATDDFIIDAAADITLDAAGDDILLKSGGTHEGNINFTNSNLTFKSIVSDKDMIFQGNDGGAAITALTLDMSEAGAATFNGNVTVGGDLDVTGSLDLSDANLTNVGSISLDSISGDGDTDTSITFSGSNVITVANGGTGQVTFNDGSISPVSDSDVDLGTTSLRFKDIYIDSATVTGEVTATGFTGTLDGILGSGTAAAATVTTLDTSGAVNLNLVTDSTSSTSGALIVDGGVGVAKKLFVGTDFDVSGNSVIDGTALVTGVATFGDDVVSDTDSTDDLGTTSVRWANLFVDAITATDQITATGFTGTLDGILGSGTAAAATTTTLAATTGTFSGILKTDSTQAATSTTDGSLQTDGGLSVAADAIIGDDLKLLSDGAIITMGANSDINLTHVHDTGITTNGELTSTVIRARKPIKTEFNASGAVTASLTAAESGATVLIHGTENNVINLPAAATTNPGLYYDFVVLTAVGGGTSTIVNIAGSGGQFVGALSLAGGTAANAVLDNAGDAFTFIASTVVGSRARITCLTDDGTDGVWQVESLASPIATID